MVKPQTSNLMLPVRFWSRALEQFILFLFKNPKGVEDMYPYGLGGLLLIVLIVILLIVLL